MAAETDLTASQEAELLFQLENQLSLLSRIPAVLRRYRRIKSEQAALEKGLEATRARIGAELQSLRTESDRQKDQIVAEVSTLRLESQKERESLREGTSKERRELEAARSAHVDFLAAAREEQAEVKEEVGDLTGTRDALKAEIEAMQKKIGNLLA